MRLDQRRQYRLANPSDPLNRYLADRWPLYEGPGSLRARDVGLYGRMASRLVVHGSNIKWVADQSRHGFVAQFTNGTGNYLEAADTLVGNVASQSLSLTAWVKYSSSFGNNFPGIASKATFANTLFGYLLHIRSGGADNGKPAFQVGDGVNTATATWSAAKTDSVWHFCACVIDRTTQLAKISVDGAAFVTANCSAVGSLNNSSSVGTFRCAVRPDGSFLSNWYNGSLSDVRLYNGLALTLDHVRALYDESRHGIFRRPPIMFALPTGGGGAPPVILQTAISVIG